MPTRSRPIAILLATSFCLAACSDPPPPTNFPNTTAKVVFSPGPDLAEPRYLHASGALADGRVLVCGGLDKFVQGDGFHALGSCEIFDPEAFTLAPGPALIGPRLVFRMVRLPDGTLVAMGGQHRTNYLKTVERFDPAQGAWNATSPMAEQRIYFTATYSPADSMIVVAGGVSDIVPQSEVYRTIFETWLPAAGPMAQVRSYHGATALLDARILVSGGFADLDAIPGAEAIDAAEVFDPATRTWTATGSMLEPRASHSLTTLPDGKALAVGGRAADSNASNTVETYDPSTGAWTAAAPMLHARTNHDAILLVGGRRLLVTGGTGDDGGLVAEAEILDIETGEWSPIGDLGLPRGGHTTELLPDGRVMILGGADSAPMRSTEIFTPPCASNLECTAGHRCAVEGVCVVDTLQ
ncbi:kelch repeat-containing protein [Polyangium sp. y55x31]|uniref:Kelch repeat-containing protein n=1 Tax=Polyangium sp. y55x31 TaxID=3042688 RepID=UPI0024830587|nr:kelch repeat-containing protein [Polyangium sp. y55x31]MDI1484057.1 kelch repeat-containing protein [Polyangium sp. y55x31]